MGSRTLSEAIILAGGLGTRLAHILPEVCKPMAPVAGQPFLRFLMNQLADNGFTRVVIADGYRREQIENYFGDSYRGMQVIYSPEDDRLLTGGATKQALRHCNSSWVFVLNGDTWLNADFSTMESKALSLGGNMEAVISTKRMKDFDRYGTIDVTDNGIVVAFHEKKPTSEGLINAGMYLIRKDALDEMPAKFSLEQDYFEEVVNKGVLSSAECTGDFIDIGIPEDYAQAQILLQPLVKSWKLAIFDRDGTINIDIGHLHEPDKVQLIDKTVDIIRRYSNNPDYKIVVATNQAGIAKGLYGLEQMVATNRAIATLVESRGGRIDAWYYCPHHPNFTGPCQCRKPAPGMILAALRDFDADPNDCIMFGDSDKDEQAAQAANVKFTYIM